MSEAIIRAIRTACAVTKADHVHALRVFGPNALDVLDAVTTSRLFARENQMLQTLMLNLDGTVFADVFVCLDEDSWILLAEGPSRAALIERLGPSAQVTDLRETHTLWSIDGPYAWELTSALLGPEVLGAPYLSFMHLREATCFRAGKTGEYGYFLLVPLAGAPALWDRLWELGRPLELVEGTLAALDQCAIENWHFTIRALDPALKLLPAELQLQWRVDATKKFEGAEALRAQGAPRRLCCFTAKDEAKAGADVTFEGQRIGAVVTAGFSTTRADWVGWAVLDAAYGWSGIARYAAGGVPLQLCSPPVIDNRSLFVDPRKHTWRTRHEHELPPLVRP